MPTQLHSAKLSELSHYQQVEDEQVQDLPRPGDLTENDEGLEEGEDQEEVNVLETLAMQKKISHVGEEIVLRDINIAIFDSL